MKPYLLLAGLALPCIVAFLGCASTSTSSTGAAKITMNKPSNQTLGRGATNTVEIKIWKENINADVSVHFENLPYGVEVTEKDTNSKDNHCVANYQLSASVNARLVTDQVVRVTAQGPDGLAVTQSFEMTVTQ
ncbi:MAG: hypothetical protein K8T20_08700 [Planctomycetes bacterium]|nr:hypothetical protein [Planctomycetota bacterium]